MDLKHVFANELKRNLEASDAFKSKLANLPEGTLRADVRGDKVYYSRRIGGRSYYINSRDTKLIDQLKERKFNAIGLEIVEKNIRCLQILCENYHSFTTGDIVKRMPKSYLHDSESTGIFNGRYIDARDWENANYPKRDWNPLYKKPGHLTLKGDSVRSKSELTIANILYSNGIPYHYEEEMEIDGIMFCPDFKIYVEKSDRFVLLEHCGLMMNGDYQRSYGRKVARYIAADLMPWRDVFFTYDDRDGNLDTQIIQKIVEMFFK